MNYFIEWKMKEDDPSFFLLEGIFYKILTVSAGEHP
jgi:hypothetical protein